MRKGIYIVVAAVALICLVAVSSAKAQSTNRVVLQADILQLRSADGHGALVQMGSIIGKADDSAKLIFNRYGNHYYFTQAWMPGTKTGLKASRSGAERAIERELATNKPRIVEVALTARR